VVWVLHYAGAVPPLWMKLASTKPRG
jgi:hypothetical protein